MKGGRKVEEGRKEGGGRKEGRKVEEGGGKKERKKERKKEGTFAVAVLGLGSPGLGVDLPSFT
jgi:hypothetical protein